MSHRVWKRTIAAFLALIGLAVMRSVLAAPPLISADADGNLGTNVGPVTASSSEVRQTQTGSTGAGSTSGLAAAKHGFLQARGQSSTVPGPGDLFGGGSSSYQDNFQIDSDGRLGQTGYITLGAVVAGAMTAQAQAPESAINGISYAQSSLQIFAQDLGSPLFSRTQQVFSNGTSTSPALINQEHRVTFPFIFGTPFDIKVVLNATGRAYRTNGGSYNSDVSASWLGIIAVRDTPGGPQVPFYFLQTGSMVNYGVPIPPPTIEAVTRLMGGSKFLDCDGVPFREHRVEASDHPSGIFQLLGTITAAADGQMTFTDNNTTLPRRIYRLIYIPPP